MLYGGASISYASNDIKHLNLPFREDDEQEIIIPDPNLEKKIKSYIGVQDTKTIRYKDIIQLDRIDGRNINFLNGLDKAHNLKKINFSDGGIKDLTPLGNLSSIEVLELPNQAIDNITPLEQLGKNVRQVVYQHEINLNDNNIKDLSPLKSWQNLHILKVNNNPVEDISFLLELSKLQKVELKGINLNKENWYMLRDLKRKGVEVSYKDNLNSETDIFFLDKNLEDAIREKLKILSRPITAQDMKELTELNLANRGITRLQGLEYAHNLEKLNISFNDIKDFDVVLPSLKELDISATKIEQISSLEKNPKLEILKAKSLYIIGAMPKLSNIVEFDFSNSYMRNLTSISKRTYYTLKKLNLNDAYFIEKDIKEIERIESEGIKVVKGSLSTIKYADIRLYLNNEVDEQLTNLDQLEMSSNIISSLFGWEKANHRQRNVPVHISEDGRNYINLPNIALAKDYEVIIKTNDYRFKEKVNLLLDKPTINLESTILIKGKMLDKDGIALARQKIKFSNHKFNQSVLTDKNGDFRLITHNKDFYTISTRFNEFNLEMKQLKLSEISSNQVDIGIYQLPKADPIPRIHGTIVNSKKEPLNDIGVSIIDENGYIIDGTSSAEGGYFSCEVLENKKYTVKIYGESLGYKDLVLHMEPDVIEKVIVLTKDNNENPFEGEGNIIIPSTEVVAAGKQVSYTIKYQNDNTEPIENFTISIPKKENFELLESSIKLNDVSAPIVNGTDIELSSLQANESGEVRLTTLVKGESLEPIQFEVEFKSNGKVKHKMSKKVTKIIATIDTPTIINNKNIGLYGLASPNAQITVVVNGKSMVTTTANEKLWMTNIVLPVKGRDEVFDIKLKVVNRGVTYESPIYKFDYTTEPSNLIASSIYVGKTKIPVNPSVKLPTATNIIIPNAMYPAQDMEFYLTFDKPINNGYIKFLNKIYSLNNVYNMENKYVYLVKIKGTWQAYQNQTVELYYPLLGTQHSNPLLLVIPLIDPSGYVFEGSMENRLESVQTTVQQKRGSLWRDWQASEFGQVNPLYSDKQGRYGWDVVQGDWRVIFSKPNYQTYTSRTVSVPPPETKLNIPLVSKQPLNAEVEMLNKNKILIRFNRPVNEIDLTSLIRIIRQDTGQEVDGMFSLQNWSGYKETAPGVFEENKNQLLSKEVIFSIITNDLSNEDYTVVIDKAVTDYRGEKLKETKNLSTENKKIDSKHVFKINFSNKFDMSTIYESVTVKDEKGELILVKLEKHGQVLHVLPPNGAYKRGNYTLNINHNLRGDKNQKLRNPKTLIFSVK